MPPSQDTGLASDPASPNQTTPLDSVGRPQTAAGDNTSADPSPDPPPNTDVQVNQPVRRARVIGGTLVDLDLSGAARISQSVTSARNADNGTASAIPSGPRTTETSVEAAPSTSAAPAPAISPLTLATDDTPTNPSTAVPSYTPDPANTRALLTALEELRDSLSMRVDQLSVAVERLRGQATELERAVSTGSSLAPGFGRPRTSNIATAFEPLALPELRIPQPPRLHPRFATAGAATGQGLGETHAADADGGAATTRSNRVGGRRARTRVDLNAAAAAAIRHAENNANASADLPSPPPIPRTPPRPRATGMAPTNRDLIASQPKPTVVRSLVTSEPSPGPDESNAAEGSSSGGIRQNNASSDAPTSSRLEPPRVEIQTATNPPRPETQSADQEQPRPRLRSPWPTEGPAVETITRQNDATEPAVSFFEDFRRRLNERNVPPGLAMDPGMTLRGMRVEQRIRAAEQPISPTSPAPAPAPNTQRTREALNTQRSRDELDREIRQVYRRLEESQRNWYQHWNAERARNMHPGGRVPNEYTAGRENAIRAHVENSHLLWTLVSRRSQLYGASPIITDIRVDGPVPAESRAPGDAMRHILEIQPTFLRLDPRSWPGPVTEQPRRETTDAETEALIGVVSVPVPFAEPSETLRDATPSRTREPVSPGFSFDDDVPPTHVRQRLIRYIERSRERVHQIARDLSPELLATEEPAMRRVLDGIELMMATPNLTPHIRSRLERLAARERALLQQVERGVAPSTGGSQRANRSDVRAAANTTVDRQRERLLTERDNLAREGERLLAERQELERTRERLERRQMLLLDAAVSTGAIGASPEDSIPYLSPTQTTQMPGLAEYPFPDGIAERIERSRARVRDLSRVYRELQATRATLGFDSAPRSESLSRRGSDADTVVPPTFSVSDITTFEAEETPPPIPPPPARLTQPAEGEPGSVTNPIRIPDSPRLAPEWDLPAVEPAPSGPTLTPNAPPRDLSVAMAETNSTASSSSQESSASSSSHRATLSHARDESPSSERKESGPLDAGNWPTPPRSRRPPRPYVSLLDL